MSKAANRRANRAEFLGETLRAKAPKWTPPKELEPTPRRQDCICKPNNPAWIDALKRKCEQYKKRLENDNDLFFLETRYKLFLIEAILRDGYANVYDCRKAFCEKNGFDIDFQGTVHAEKIVEIYCYRGGDGMWSPDGAFLPS